MEERSNTAGYDGVGGFGDPDGSRENFGSFIVFKEHEAWGGLSTRKDDLSARVLVGAKGSGKTIYKRILEDTATKSDDFFVFGQNFQLPPTGLISQFGEFYPTNTEDSLFSKRTRRRRPPSEPGIRTVDVTDFTARIEDNLRTEHWQLLWRRAIFKSLVSLFYAARPEKNLGNLAYSREQFYDEFSDLFPRDYFTPESILNQVGEMISKYSNRKHMDEYLLDPRWESLEKVIQANLRLNRPVCYFIDAIDEDFRHAPAQWLDCQKGLFYAVFRLLRDPEMDNSLHVIICIRDVVYSAVLQTSEHATRYTHSPHIRILDWGIEAAREFLNNKIRRLPERHLMKGSRGGSEVAKWLGVETIRNEKRGVEENVGEYVLRHTRFFPRDIVNMGNALCVKIDECKAKERWLTPEEIRETVSRTAAMIANEAIRICGNHLAVSALPRFGLNQKMWTGSEFLIDSDWAGAMLENMIRRIDRDVLSWDDFRTVLRDYQPEFDRMAEKNQYRQYRIDTILWQHGLLGYREQSDARRCVFYSTSPTRSYFLPENKPQYVFHASLIDMLGIKSVGSHPIGC